MSEQAPERKTFPFTPVDETFIHMSTDRHPYNVHVEVRAPGRLDSDRLRKAIQTALGRHPMACSQLAVPEEKDAQLEWEHNETPEDPLLVLEADSDKAVTHIRNKLVSMVPNIYQAPAIIVWLVRHDEGDIVMFNYHHALADGMSSIRFMQSVTRTYAGEEDPISGPDEIEVRNEKLDFKTAEMQTRDRIKQMALIARGMAGKPAAVAIDNPDYQAGYCCRIVKLSSKEFKKLNYKQYNATFNDLVIGALHKTIELWNQQHGEEKETDNIRIPVPVNLRPAEWYTDVMGNYFNTFMTNTNKKDRKDPQKLMKAISTQTSQCKQYKVAAAMFSGINGNTRMPAKYRQLILKSMMNVRTCTSNCTNVGKVGVVSFGDHGEATEVVLSGPAPYPYAMIIGVTFYNGQLYLSFRYCRDMLNQTSGDSLADLFTETLSRLGKSQ